MPDYVIIGGGVYGCATAWHLAKAGASVTEPNTHPNIDRQLCGEILSLAEGRAKVELALAKGKQAHDKRQSIKERDWKRDKARLMRDRG